MKIRMASILVLLGCFVFSAGQNTFAFSEFDNFRQADGFRFNEQKGGFQFDNGFDFGFSNGAFANRNADFSRDFNAFGRNAFDKSFDRNVFER